jgi:hypothetical protein
MMEQRQDYIGMDILVSCAELGKGCVAAFLLCPRIVYKRAFIREIHA